MPNLKRTTMITMLTFSLVFGSGCSSDKFSKAMVIGLGAAVGGVVGSMVGGGSNIATGIGAALGGIGGFVLGREMFKK